VLNICNCVWNTSVQSALLCLKIDISTLYNCLNLMHSIERFFHAIKELKFLINYFRWCRLTMPDQMHIVSNHWWKPLMRLSCNFQSLYWQRLNKHAFIQLCFQVPIIIDLFVWFYSEVITTNTLGLMLCCREVLLSTPY
jgi:hypothetical protein